MKAVSLILALATVIMAVMAVFLPASGQTLPQSQTATIQPSPMATETIIVLTAFPTATPEPVSTAVITPPVLGLSGGVECWNCAPFRAVVRLTNYNPMAGKFNCFDYDEEKKYCYSPTSSQIHWKSVYGFGAACPREWKPGTWVQIDRVGTFICFDTGDLIYCQQDDEHGQVCAVDILTDKIEWWNGGVFTVTLWVPLDPPRNK